MLNLVPPAVAYMYYGCEIRSQPYLPLVAIAVSVIPALLESRDPLGPYRDYRRLLNFVLVAVP
jgi:hypothetical protein